MPFINVKTNVSVSADKAEAVKSGLGQAVTAIPGKSEAWLMVGIEPEYKLWFKGSDAPAAMVEVSVYGSENPRAFEDLTGRICDLLTAQLNIDASRIYVKYEATSNWGWNGGNF